MLFFSGGHFGLHFARFVPGTRLLRPAPAAPLPANIRTSFTRGPNHLQNRSPSRAGAAPRHGTEWHSGHRAWRGDAPAPPRPILVAAMPIVSSVSPSICSPSANPEPPHLGVSDGRYCRRYTLRPDRNAPAPGKHSDRRVSAAWRAGRRGVGRGVQGAGTRSGPLSLGRAAENRVRLRACGSRGAFPCGRGRGRRCRWVVSRK